MSQSAAPATQNNMTTCFDTFEKERFCSFPHRHGHRKTRDSRRDMREHQNEHFARDLRQFWHFVASKSMFSREFSLEPLNLLPQNRCFVRGLRQFSAHLTKCHACHGICTLSPLDAALTVRLEKHATRHVWSAAPATQNDDGHVQSAAPATKTATHLLKTSQKYCACHAKRLSPRITKHVWMSRSATPATRTEATPYVKPPKVTPFCRTYHRHGHTALARTVADGCERLRTVANGCERLQTVADGWASSSEHTLNPQTPRVKREPLLRIGEKLQSLVGYVKRGSKHSNTVKTRKTFHKPLEHVQTSLISLFIRSIPYISSTFPIGLSASL